MITNNEIFLISEPKTLTRHSIENYLKNIELEIEQGLFTQAELLLLQDALYGKFLDKSHKLFFLYHFLPLWVDSVQTLFCEKTNPTVIELGCGTGTSSLLFAMLGASVIGIDMDADLIGICNKQKEFYKKNGVTLDAKFYHTNTFEFPFEEHAPVDAFFSLFAFNLMKPSDVLLARMIPSLKHGGKIIIIDGNCNSLYNRLIPSRRRSGVLSPVAMKQELERLGCRVLNIKTHCALPPFVFRFKVLKDIAINIEQNLKSSSFHKFLGVSYMIVAERV